MITYLFIGYLVGTYLGVYLNIQPLFLLLFPIIIVISISLLLRVFSKTFSKLLIKKYMFKAMLIILAIIIASIRINSINNVRDNIYEFNNNAKNSNKKIEYFVKIIEKEEQEYSNRYIAQVLEYKDNDKDDKKELGEINVKPNSNSINSFKKIKVIFRTKVDLSAAKTYKIAGNLKNFKEEINYKGFNEREYYYSKGIDFRLEIDEKKKDKEDKNKEQITEDKESIKDDITEIENNRLQALDYILLIKEKINNSVDQYIVNSEIFRALFLGNSNDLDEDTKLNFKSTNVYHVLAMSGMHISYLVLILNVTFKKTKVKINFKFKKTIQIIILIAYMLLVGSTTSVSRAVFSVIIALIFKEFNIRYGFLNSMLFSICIILLINPYTVYNAGFYLSYIAAISIYFFLKIEENLKLISKLTSYISRKVFKNKYHTDNKSKGYEKTKRDRKDSKYYIEKGINFIFLDIYISIVVYISLLPLLIYFFNEISINFFIANLLLSMILPVIMILGFLFIFASLSVNLISLLPVFLHFVANVLNVHIVSNLAKVLDFLLKILTLTVEKVSSLDNISNSMLYLRSPSILFILVYYIILIFIFFIFATNTSEFHSRKMYINNGFNRFKRIVLKRKILSLLILLIFIFSNVFLDLSVRNGEYKLGYISVGQGDSSFIITPKNTTVLVDAGSNQYFDNGKEVRRYIFARRQKDIDHLFISHFDIDHVGGVYTLIESVRIGQIYIPKYVERYLEKEIVRKYGSINNELIEKFKEKQSVNQKEKEEKLSIVEEDFLNYYILKQKAKEKNVDIIELERGDSLVLDKDTTVEVLFPIKDLVNVNFSNNNSLVFKLKCNINSENNSKNNRSFSVLYTGDIEKDAIKKLLDLDRLEGVAKNEFSLKSSILKVPHHGSKYSLNEEFLEKVNPSISVISAGEDNIYGHPHKEVLNALEKIKSKTYNTKISGEIFLTENEIFSY